MWQRWAVIALPIFIFVEFQGSSWAKPLFLVWSFKFEVWSLKFEVGQSHITSNLKLQTSNFLLRTRILRSRKAPKPRQTPNLQIPITQWIVVGKARIGACPPSDTFPSSYSPFCCMIYAVTVFTFGSAIQYSLTPASWYIRNLSTKSFFLVDFVTWTIISSDNGVKMSENALAHPCMRW